MKVRGILATLATLFAVAIPVLAQDDVTTRNGSSGYDGAWVTGPASNPLSFLNGNAFRTTGSNSPYLLPDFRPASLLDRPHPLPPRRNHLLLMRRQPAGITTFELGGKADAHA